MFSIKVTSSLDTSFITLDYQTSEISWQTSEKALAGKYLDTVEASVTVRLQTAVETS